MSVKKSQAILKYFLDLKNRRFGLRSEKRIHVMWHLQLFSGRLPGKVLKALDDRQSYILSKSKFLCSQ